MGDVGTYSIGGGKEIPYNESPSPATVPVSGVWLRRVGDQVEVLVEVEETWRGVSSCTAPGAEHLSDVSQVIDPAGILGAPQDWNTCEVS